ncbi:MAG: VCBS repeat-containing protein [Candidatus Eiseniibacteriota bacterium]|nr:MAG: VCBS repeat-containing protein [Candidatus Eisenbacteria bacterium]
MSSCRRTPTGQRLSGLFLVVLLLVVWPGVCDAQCPEGTCLTACTYDYWRALDNRWVEADLPVVYYINKDGASDCTGNEFLTVQRALSNWEYLNQAFWAACYAGTTSARSTAHNVSPVKDGFNVVSWEDMGSGTPLKLGRAHCWYDASDHNYECDISLNDNAAVSWSALKQDSCVSGEYDLESISTHEFGHWMSFDHSCDSLATMHCWTKAGDTFRRSPNECDIRAMKWYYTQIAGTPKSQPGCWPQYISGGVNSNPVLGDINRDGIEDIVVAGDDGQVHVFSGRGKELTGWPQSTGGMIDGSPALGDVDGDGWLEVVVGSYTDSVYVFNPNGSRAANWPQGTNWSVRSTPAIADLDQDGVTDVICASTDSCVYAWSGTSGTALAGWPVKLGGNMQLAGPALADLDGDDSLEVVISGYDNKVYALKPHGANLSGWPVWSGRKVYDRVAIGDVDGDNEFEVVATAMYDSAYAWNANGSRCSGWPVYIAASTGYSAPSLGDIDGDNSPEIVFGSDNDTLYAFNGDASLVTGWPKYVDGQVRGSALIVDIDGDNAYEVIAATDNGKVYAFNGNGTTVSGWPITYEQWYYRSPAIGETNGDNELDLVVGSTGNDSLYAYSLGTILNDSRYEWRMYGNDFNRTSRYGFAPDPPEPIRFSDPVADFSHWELFGSGASVSLSTMSYSPPTSMGVTGSPSPGDFASAYSEFITVDFSRPYTIKFAFAYDNFFWSTWLVFGHARFRLDNPTAPVLMDVAGDWSSLVPVGPPFNNYTPPMAYAEYEIQVEPTTRNVQLLVNGVPAGGATYSPSVVPSNRMWLSDDAGPSEFLTGWYDDFEVRGYLPVVSVRPEKSPEPPLLNALHQSYPNPMNPSATIRYSVRETGRVSIRIYDVAGRLIRVLVDEEKAASHTPYSVVWNGKDDSGRRVASGVYFCRMETKNFASANKIVLLR